MRRHRRAGWALATLWLSACGPEVSDTGAEVVYGAVLAVDDNDGDGAPV